MLRYINPIHPNILMSLFMAFFIKLLQFISRVSNLILCFMMTLYFYRYLLLYLFSFSKPVILLDGFHFSSHFELLVRYFHSVLMMSFHSQLQTFSHYPPYFLLVYCKFIGFPLVNQIDCHLIILIHTFSFYFPLYISQSLP